MLADERASAGGIPAEQHLAPRGPPATFEVHHEDDEVRSTGRQVGRARESSHPRIVRVRLEILGDAPVQPVPHHELGDVAS
ncbi:MAG TPA: hypothetical protein PKC43_06575 [Phycisphaerales bacterium]|nr:hypothetical protein [Phycisphaerales bacterium]HMP37096.1 hypothetical protein [Phycisphaerales bacterium]